MWWTIMVILLVLWMVGMLTEAGGAFIHLLLAGALVVLLISLASRRPTNIT